MSETNRNERIQRLNDNEDVPFDEAVLEEMTDEQIDAIDPEPADDGDGVPDGDTDEQEGGGDADEGDDLDAESDAGDEGDSKADPDETETETGTGTDESDTESMNTDMEPETADSPESPGEDTSEVEAKVNALEERINALEQENEDLRQKADPDVVQRMNAIETLADHYDTDPEEFEHLGKETAVRMANDLSADDSRENAFAQTQAQAQQAQGQAQRTNMLGVPGGVDRSNSEDDLDDIPAAGREAWEARQQND